MLAEAQGAIEKSVSAATLHHFLIEPNIIFLLMVQGKLPIDFREGASPSNRQAIDAL